MLDGAIGVGDVTTDAIAHAIDGLHAIENGVRLKRLDWIVEYDTREAWKEDAACSVIDRHRCARRSERACSGPP